ncbi:hypothetical protein K1719_004273 [Acacia pycnantha]|nr:hypothetical protein K1719_004273 [Acacia pycnantha]
MIVERVWMKNGRGWPLLKKGRRKELGRSFSEILQGINHAEREDGNVDDNNPLAKDMLSDDSLSETEEEDSEPLCVITENKNRNFPTFAFSDKMKKRLYKAWDKAVIIKLLGKTIGYKILLSILQSWWAKKGVIRLINIGNGYFVVKLTNREDYFHALTGGPWLLFDHYLTVMPWEPQFNPWKATISKCKSGNKGETIAGQQERKEGECSTGSISSGEIKVNDSDVWRVVEKPRRRKKESNQKRAVDPTPAPGSRFEVLDVEEEREVIGMEEKQLVPVGASPEVTCVGVAEMGDNPRGPNFVQFKRKAGGRLSRKPMGKQGRKENVVDRRKEVQRVEKRSRGNIQRKEEELTSMEVGFGQGAINGEGMGSLTKQDRREGDQIGSSNLVLSELSVPSQLDAAVPLQMVAQNSDLLDPGEDGPNRESGPVQALKGKFWDHNEPMEEECSHVAQSEEDLMGSGCGPQAKEI